MLVSCDKEDDSNGMPPPTPYYIEDSSFVQIYVYGDPHISNKIFSGYRDGLVLSIVSTPHEECRSPYFYNNPYFGPNDGQQSEEEKNKFLQTARENGDLHYTGRVDRVHIAFARHLREIHLTCNVDWDEAHPAGTLLDDIFYMTCYPYASFFKSNYTEWNQGTKAFSQLTPEDLYIFRADNIIWAYTPDHLFGKEITFFLKVMMDDGSIIESQHTVHAKDWKECFAAPFETKL